VRTSSIKTEDYCPFAVFCNWRNAGRVRTEDGPSTFQRRFDCNFGLGAVGCETVGLLIFVKGFERMWGETVSIRVPIRVVVFVGFSVKSLEMGGE
jgi:hypothetical protein